MKLKKTTVITVGNHKGGSGKTSVTGGLGYALAETGYQVLLVDGCGQMNLTRSYGFNKEQEKSLFPVIMNGAPVEDCIQNGPHENLHFIIADDSMASLDTDMFILDQREGVIERSFRKVIESGTYDFVIFDTNPSLGLLNLNFMVASQEMLIPVELSPFGIDGMDNLFKFFVRAQKVNPDIRILGAVFNKVDYREKITREAMEVVHHFFGDVVLKTSIPTDVKVKEAQWDRVPLGVFVEQSKGKKGKQRQSRAKKEFVELAQEVLEIVKERDYQKR